VSPFVLSVLKYALLALLYFFVFRAVRSVAVDVSGRRRETAAGRPAKAPAPAPSPPRSARAKPPSQVVIHEPDGAKPRSMRLDGSVDIGRSERCAIRLDDTYVSQMHARLYGDDGTWYVEDLGSTNGTFVNDRKVERTSEVHSGDVVKIGKTLLELRR
jgi:pSer/pThr/pTyr-binding forkhead associated (FHA) protein